MHPRLKPKLYWKEPQEIEPGSAWSFIRNASGGNHSYRCTGGCFSFMKWNMLSGWKGLKSFPFPINLRTLAKQLCLFCCSWPWCFFSSLESSMLQPANAVVSCRPSFTPPAREFLSGSSPLQTEQATPASSQQKLDTAICIFEKNIKNPGCHFKPYHKCLSCASPLSLSLLLPG